MAVKLKFDVTEDLHRRLQALAEREGVDLSEILRRAFSVVIAFDDARAKDMRHIGFSRDPGRLDIELTGILEVPQGATGER